MGNRIVIATGIIPMPPSINHAYIRSVNGVFNTKEIRQWRDEAYFSWIATGTVPDKKVPPKTSWGWSASFRMSGRRRDMDNCYKSIQDLIAAVIGADDRYCDEDYHRKVVSPKYKNDVEITVYIIGDEDEKEAGRS
jgi:Holliday junction resolvase RusA-like endonuclease